MRFQQFVKIFSSQTVCVLQIAFTVLAIFCKVIEQRPQYIRAALAGNLNHFVSNASVPTTHHASTDQHLQRWKDLPFSLHRTAVEPNRRHSMLSTRVHTTAD